MKIQLFAVLVFLLVMSVLPAQVKMSSWDNTVDKYWPEGFAEVNIISKSDSIVQKAVFYKSTHPDPQPLIISLHTWSGDYLQEDPLAEEVKLRNWNYIHPDFRGPNDDPAACGSELVIADLEDAIDYALLNCNADLENIFIIGVSGGGYTTLMAYLKLNRHVKSFHAWVPISDLNDWYWESRGRKNKYYLDLEKVAFHDGKINWHELDLRSPLKHHLSRSKQGKSSLYLFAGVHDGYTGTVPITHSIKFFNKLAEQFYPGGQDRLIAESTVIELLTKRLNPDLGEFGFIGQRPVHLKNELDDLKLYIFEGGHEMLVDPALALLPVQEMKCMKQLNILTIGDSNAASAHGWPNQMGKLLPFSFIMNKSVPGNTIGFNNLENEKLNTLNQIEQYLDEAMVSLPDSSALDFIFIGLGTNDTKAVFKDRQHEVSRNLEQLIRKIKAYFELRGMKQPEICIISVPPVDPFRFDQDKYGGSETRIPENNTSFEQICKKQKVDFLDTFIELKQNFDNKTEDGIHLKPEAQFEIARMIVRYLNNKIVEK